MQYERICEQCERVFPAKNKDTRFCSPRCNRKMRWKLHKVQQSAYHKKWCQENKEKMTAHQIRYLHNEMQLYPWRSLIRSTQKRAAKEGITHTLTSDWGEKNWTGKCAVTGIRFASPAERYGRKNRHFFPSIDKIEPNKGYIPENCRFVLWAVNAFKGDGTDETMLFIAKAISVSSVGIHSAADPGMLRIA